MTIVYVIITSMLIAISNLFIQLSVNAGRGSGDPFLIARLFFSGLIAGILAYIRTGNLQFDTTTLILGTIAGFMLGTLMWMTGKTLCHGPSGLSFAIINGAAIIPPILMALLFGKVYGHEYTLRNAFGALLVFIGLLWAGWQRTKINKLWLLFVSISFIIQALYLAFFQWRALIVNPASAISALVPFHSDPEAANLFMLVTYITSSAFQWILPVSYIKKHITLKLIVALGVMGGLINGAGGYFMMLATEAAQFNWEKALIFPLYAVLLIAFCDIWARIIYKEKVHWLARALCFTGIFIGAS